MKYITVKLTKDQADKIVEVFGDPHWVQNSDYPMSDPDNAFAQRIATKISKELAKSQE